MKEGIGCDCRDWAYLFASFVGCYDPVEPLQTRDLVLMEIDESWVVRVQANK